MACCEFGSATLTVNGQNYSMRGEFTLQPNTFMRETGANEDGSRFSTRKRQLAWAEGSLDGCNLDTELWDFCDATVVFVLSSGDIYTYTNAAVEGSPEINTSTGEVSGFRITSTRVIKQKRNTIA